jgi:DNA-binding GntR family transcriptional regulator
MDDNTLQQIERGDLVESVLDQITAAIVTGRLRPGDKLVETRMGDQLGVSRGPVREAVRRLEQMGLVQKIPYRGTFVASLTPDDVRELHDLRAPMEGLAARLVAERQNPEHMAHLEGLVAQMRDFPADSDRAKMVALDADFHDSLILFSGHKLLQELWMIIGARLRTFLALKTERLYETPREAAALHEPIVAAIRAGDPEAAERTACHHVVEAGHEHVLNWRASYRR